MIRRMARCAMALTIAACISGCVAAQEEATQNALKQIEKDTGLVPVTVPDAKESYLGKTHRGYQVLYHANMGNVWGRYAARLTMGELGEEGNCVVRFMTGGYEHLGAHPAGSPLDRLLARVIGQPLSVTIVLAHGKPSAPRLDVLSGYSKIVPEDPLPKFADVGFNAGDIYSADKDYAARVASSKALMKRLKNLRSQYIRVDDLAVSFLWAGQENDYSGMINDHGGYAQMLNAIMDDLADLADAIPNPQISPQK